MALFSGDISSAHMKSILTSLFAGALAAIALSGCGKLAREKDLASDAMDQFHERFNAGDFDKIFDTADADFQRARPRGEFLNYIEAVHGKLGDYKNCDNHGWSTNFINSDTTVTLHYKTTFTKGTGDEEFVYRVSGARATLQSYQINSDKLNAE